MTFSEAEGKQREFLRFPGYRSTGQARGARNRSVGIWTPVRKTGKTRFDNDRLRAFAVAGRIAEESGNRLQKLVQPKKKKKKTEKQKNILLVPPCDSLYFQDDPIAGMQLTRGWSSYYQLHADISDSLSLSLSLSLATAVRPQTSPLYLRHTEHRLRNIPPSRCKLDGDKWNWPCSGQFVRLGPAGYFPREVSSATKMIKDGKVSLNASLWRIRRFNLENFKGFKGIAGIKGETRAKSTSSRSALGQLDCSARAKLGCESIDR